MQPIKSNYKQLQNVDEYRALADALGDTPETVISVHALRRGLCRAYLAGDLPDYDGAIVHVDFLPAEPTGYGKDAQILWNLLKMIEGWECIDVNSQCAVGLGEIIKREMRLGVRYYGDIYYTLDKPVVDSRNESVRRLSLADLKLLESAPKELQGCGFGSIPNLLTEGIVAGAVKSGNVVSIAHTSAITNCYADIGVCTHKEWGGRGFAAAAASVVAGEVQKAGRKPVWSTGEDNKASIRVAQKLGFAEVSRRTYVILEKAE